MFSYDGNEISSDNNVLAYDDNEISKDDNGFTFLTCSEKNSYNH